MIAGFCFGRTVPVDEDLSADLSRDFTGDSFVSTVSLVFALRAALAFASTHLAQLGSAQAILFFVFVDTVLPDACECVSL
jgi:hypothetical protein